MISRRMFLSAAAASGAAWWMAPAWRCVRGAAGGPGYALRLESPTRRYDGESCWVHARAGIVPGVGKENAPRAVMTMNLKDLSGSDLFDAVYDLYSDDLGEEWSEPREVETLAPETVTVGDADDVRAAVSDFWPRWHRASQTLLGTGHTVKYHGGRVMTPRPRHTAYSRYEPGNGGWTPWERLPMPDEDRFHNMGAGCTQRHDLPDGSILLPVYGVGRSERSSVYVLKCGFDGQTLTYETHGERLHVDDDTRGLHEPSLTRFDGTYYLTIRNDRKGYVTRSQDGLDFEPIRPWTFDDGEELGNYNTQQHWVTHSQGLFLVYTRRGADNDHVFRHRAPLFMGQVDPDRLCVIRDTEQVVAPERGARLGNFGVTDVSPDETWVTVAEWMQPEGVDEHGSDGSVFIARIQWERPNELFAA